MCNHIHDLQIGPTLQSLFQNCSCCTASDGVASLNSDAVSGMCKWFVECGRNKGLSMSDQIPFAWPHSLRDTQLIPQWRLLNPPLWGTSFRCCVCSLSFSQYMCQSLENGLWWCHERLKPPPMFVTGPALRGRGLRWMREEGRYCSSFHTFWKYCRERLKVSFFF